MGLFGINWFGRSEEPQPLSVSKSPAATREVMRDVQASQIYYGAAYVVSFDGEKNPGEIGPVLQYALDHERLRLRSWQAYLESEIAHTVLDRFFIWVINKGLKLQCAPVQSVLLSEGIDIDAEAFNNITEARFSVWSKSRKISHNGMQSLNDIAKDAMRNATVGGDCLVILRYEKSGLTVQLIDGAHVASPMGVVAANGNRIIDGVELDATGKHVAYHVKTKIGESERVVAWSETTGLRMAFIVYGSKYRLNDVRGVPRIATSLESLKKIERYKEAAVGSAEERAKIVYAIVHNQFSDGSNPLIETLGGLMNADNEGGDTPNARFSDGETVARAVSASTNKQTFNLPIGSKMEALESKQEMFFKEFYSTNADVICATVGIPPNVAFSIYNDSFSASRAATKDWENTIDFERDDFKNQFYDPIFAFWLHIEILNFKIQAPGYLVAFSNGNWMVTEAYLNNRFVGPMFPHIDPMKEVMAERLKMGTLGAHIPLTTAEQSTEFLNGGEYSSNVEQFADEINKAKGLGLEAVVAAPAVDTEDKDKEKDKGKG